MVFTCNCQKARSIKNNNINHERELKSDGSISESDVKDEKKMLQVQKSLARAYSARKNHNHFISDNNGSNYNFATLPMFDQMFEEHYNTNSNLNTQAKKTIQQYYSVNSNNSNNNNDPKCKYLVLNPHKYLISYVSELDVSNQRKTRKTRKCQYGGKCLSDAFYQSLTSRTLSILVGFLSGLDLITDLYVLMAFIKIGHIWRSTLAVLMMISSYFIAFSGLTLFQARNAFSDAILNNIFGIFCLTPLCRLFRMISADTGGINYQNVDLESNVVTDDMFVLSNTNVTVIDCIVENNNVTVNNMFMIDNSIANLTNEIIESNRVGALTSGKLFSLDTTILSITNVQFYKFVIVQFFCSLIWNINVQKYYNHLCCYVC